LSDAGHVAVNGARVRLMQHAQVQFLALYLHTNLEAIGFIFR